MDITIVSDGINYAASPGSFSIVYKEKIGELYMYTITFSDPTQKIKTALLGNHVVINIAESGKITQLCDGYRYSSKTTNVNGKISFSVNLVDSTFQSLNQNTYDGPIDGEFLLAISEIINYIDIIDNRDESFYIDEYVKGRHIDILNFLCFEHDILWNIRGDNLYVGNSFSNYVYSYTQDRVKIEVGYFKTLNGESRQLYDISMKLNHDIRVGDLLTIGTLSFRVAELKHMFSVSRNNSGKKISERITRSSLLTCVEDNETLIEYIYVNSSDFDLFEKINFFTPEIKYNIQSNEIIYKDQDKNLWLGDLDHYDFYFTGTGLGTGPYDMTYSGIATSPTFGPYIPKDVQITKIVYSVESSQNISVILYRNSTLLTTFSANGVSFLEKDIDLLCSGGEYLRMVLGRAAAGGFTRAHFRIYFRKIFEVD